MEKMSKFFFVVLEVPRVICYEFRTIIKTWKQIECTNVGEIKKVGMLLIGECQHERIIS
jgi:hypothetical protein